MATTPPATNPGTVNIPVTPESLTNTQLSPEEISAFSYTGPEANQEDFDKRSFAMTREVEESVQKGEATKALAFRSLQRDYYANNPEFANNQMPGENPFEDDALGRTPEFTGPDGQTLPIQF
jgi:hypothetical protein